MRKIRTFIATLIAITIILSLGTVNAHSVELDPDSLISLPIMIWGGKGEITVRSTVTDYTLYYQAVEIKENTYNQIEKIKADGDASLNALKTKLDALKTEVNNLKNISNNKFEEYEKIVNTEKATEEQIQNAKTAYETAQTNYNNKVDEYNTKVNEYNAKVEEVNTKVKELTPGYVEANWEKTADGNFSIDVSKFSGKRTYVIWAKLVSGGKTTYDAGIYTTQGTQIAVETVKLNLTEATIKMGVSLTLEATINPSNATDKSVTWTSDNEKVAKVENGVVTPVSKGTATITVTTKDGNHKATCKITVEEQDEPTNNDKEEDKTQQDNTTNQNEQNNNTNKNEQNNNTNKNEPNKNEQNSSNNQTNNDQTTAQTKLPQTGTTAYKYACGILVLIAISVITYKKVKYLNFK